MTVVEPISAEQRKRLAVHARQLLEALHDVNEGLGWKDSMPAECSLRDTRQILHGAIGMTENMLMRLTGTDLPRELKYR